MGSNSSKATSSTTSSSRNFRKRSRSKALRGFHSFCVGTSFGSRDSDDEDQVCDNNKVDDNDVDVKAGESDNTFMPNINLDEWSETRIRDISSRSRARSVHDSSTHSLNPTSRFLSRLRRFTSSKSSRPCLVSSPSFSMFDNDDDASGSGLPCCNVQRNPSCGIGARDELDVNLFSSRIQSETESIETRDIDRRKRVREPVEHKVRFSRTLSVGRLRDRVLRRSTSSNLTPFPQQQERELRDDSQNTQRPAMEPDSRVSPSDHSAISSSTPSMSNSMFSNQNYEVETSQLREGRYQDLLEHRSNFLERGRRIRSQARSLQRLGSRFENQSAHGRSCILSGQHRTGRCMCRFRNRDTNSNDDPGARASISRIVVLAEALFEVLDEIHQQSVVLSSNPSASSLGCVPAPINIVESLPVKLYEKLHKHHEDATQCYICLVEYEDGDSVRILPCHHEFHRTCIDKWLKEIHRVCPLCRGNICISDSEF